MFKLDEVITSNILTKSKLPDIDFVINPYVGCPHRCIYCYAEFMKRFTNHHEDWGTFLDVKIGYRPIKATEVEDKRILLSSVTDAYNPYEYQFKKTKAILENLKHTHTKIDILTKSHLVLRDLSLLKTMADIRVGLSMNTLDDHFRKEIEPGASSVEKRLRTLKELKKAGISTYLFMSPIFPEITKVSEIIHQTRRYVDEYYFENLNLRAPYQPRVLSYIQKSFPQLWDLYKEIYINHNYDYWEKLKLEIANLCIKENISHHIIFHYGRIES